jgi:hypothetical protein
MKGRTVILVTHAVPLALPFADYVVMMKEGCVISKGTPIEIARDQNVEEITEQMVLNPVIEEDEDLSSRTKGKGKEKDNGDDKENHSSKNKDTTKTKDEKKGTKLIEKETSATGSVQFSVYLSYFRAAGGWRFLMIFLFSFLLVRTLQFGNDYWLKKWSDASNSEIGGTATTAWDLMQAPQNNEFFYSPSVIAYVPTYPSTFASAWGSETFRSSVLTNHLKTKSWRAVPNHQSSGKETPILRMETGDNDYVFVEETTTKYQEPMKDVLYYVGVCKYIVKAIVKILMLICHIRWTVWYWNRVSE